MSLLAALALFAATAAQPETASQAARILIDGEVGDWDGVAVAWEDPVESGQEDGGQDFRRLWIANDERYLFLRLELGSETLIQVGNGLTLYLDTDDDPETGRKAYGIGAELRWTFGRREGELAADGTRTPVDHRQIGLLTAPTYSASDFEIALDRQARPGRTGKALFPSATIRVVLADEWGSWDVLPDRAGGVAYRFDESPLPAVAELPLGKLDPRHLRVLSYNVNDHLGESVREGAFKRILGAVAPDLIVFQEVRTHSGRWTEAYVRTKLGVTPPAGEWHVAKAGEEGNVLLSPFRVTEARALGGSAAFLIDPRSAGWRQLLLIVLSTPCCGRDLERQLEIDRIMSFLRDARTEGGDIHIAAGTPVVLVGDANLVGDARQRRTLLAGEIVHRDRYGPAFAPDWDGTALIDLTPRHTHRPVTFTWYGRGFSPGRLDYVMLTDSVLDAGNRFVLFTPDMPPAALSRHGLRSHDVLIASDHLPLVVDLALPSCAPLCDNPVP